MIQKSYDALHDLLAGAPALLELAAKMAGSPLCGDCQVRNVCPVLSDIEPTNWLCGAVPAQLRELAQMLRAAMGEEEADVSR